MKNQPDFAPMPTVISTDPHADTYAQMDLRGVAAEAFRERDGLKARVAELESAIRDLGRGASRKDERDHFVAVFGDRFMAAMKLVYPEATDSVCGEKTSDDRGDSGTADEPCSTTTPARGSEEAGTFTPEGYPDSPQLRAAAADHLIAERKEVVESVEESLGIRTNEAVRHMSETCTKCCELLTWEPGRRIWHCMTPRCDGVIWGGPPPRTNEAPPCSECNGTGTVEEDATGALGYTVNRPCPNGCKSRTDKAEAGSPERFERAKQAWEDVTGEDVSHLRCPDSAENWLSAAWRGERIAAALKTIALVDESERGFLEFTVAKLISEALDHAVEIRGASALRPDSPKTGALDALQIVQADRDEWKQRAIALEAQLSKVRTDLDTMIAVHDEVEADRDALISELDARHCSDKAAPGPISVERHRLGYRIALPSVWSSAMLINEAEAQELDAALGRAIGRTEVREDGATVEVKRWESGIRRIVGILFGNSHPFEIDEVVEKVRELALTREKWTETAGHSTDATLGKIRCVLELQGTEDDLLDAVRKQKEDLVQVRASLASLCATIDVIDHKYGLPEELIQTAEAAQDKCLPHWSGEAQKP